MIKRVDRNLPPAVLFLLWAMGHGDEVAVVDSRYITDLGADAAVPATVLQMGDVDVRHAVRAILSAVQLDTTFTDFPVRQIALSGPRCAVRRAVQNEVEDALGFRCSILGVAGAEFHEQVMNCYALVLTADPRKQGSFILRKGLDVTPADVLRWPSPTASAGTRTAPSES